MTGNQGNAVRLENNDGQNKSGKCIPTIAKKEAQSVMTGL
jgi:hypothetical protein